MDGPPELWTPLLRVGKFLYKGSVAIGPFALLVILVAPPVASAGPTDWTELRTLNIAHQGGEDEAPSNTMYAYDRAMRLGSDMLETDIHVTSDGKIVVIHDSTVDRTTNGTGSRPDIIKPVMYPKTLQRWFDPSSYIAPAPYTYGNAARNSLYGPGRTNWDASLFKNFVLREEMKFEIRAEAFNLPNHPQFGLPNQNIGNAQVGSITSIVGNPRQLQLGARFQF